MPKLTEIGAASRERIMDGVNRVADIVKVTLGPRGRNVVLDTGMPTPTITNDGVTIAKTIDFEDEFEKVGADLIKDVAEKTNDVAGDGTTTATVLAQAILAGWARLDEGGWWNRKKRVNMVALRKSIDQAVTFVVDRLKAQAKPVESHEEVAQIGTISSLDANVGEMIATCMDEVGKDGIITVEESKTVGLEKEIVKGMRIDKGYVSPYLVTDQAKMIAELDEPYILIMDRKLTSINELLPVLEKVTVAGQKQLVIVAEDIDGEALQMFILNKVRGLFNALAVKAPGFADRKKQTLLDIATVTGGTLISADLGFELKSVELSMLGRAHKVVSTKDHTTFIGGMGKPEEIDARIERLRVELEQESQDYLKEFLKQRIAKLSGGIGIIKVGAPSEVEMKQKRFKIEDAINACKAAVEEGIITGGGLPLFEIGEHILYSMLPDEAWTIIANACMAPLMQMLENSGQTFAEHTDYLDDVYDPVKVTRTALEKAASIAGELITTEAVVINRPDPQIR